MNQWMALSWSRGLFRFCYVWKYPLLPRGGLEIVIMRAITAALRMPWGIHGLLFFKAHFKGESVGIFSKAYVIPVFSCRHTPVCDIWYIREKWRADIRQWVRDRRVLRTWLCYPLLVMFIRQDNFERNAARTRWLPLINQRTTQLTDHFRVLFSLKLLRCL